MATTETDPRVYLIEALGRLEPRPSAIARRIGRSHTSVRAWFKEGDLPDDESIRRLVRAYPDLMPYAIAIVLPQRGADQGLQRPNSAGQVAP